MRKKLNKNQKGFTLIELLVVIAIIGILAVVAIPALFKNIEKAKVADLEADYNAFKIAVMQYYAENSDFPSSWTPGPNDLEGYMESVPNESRIGDNYYIVSNKNITVNGVTQNHLENWDMNPFRQDGSIDKSRKLKLKEEGEVFLLVRSHDKKPINISDVQLKKLCNDIGYDNIYIYSSNMNYKGNALAIKIIDKI